MTPPEPRYHAVVRDFPRLLEALAAPFGTYEGVAVCRALPGARSLEALAVELLCAVGKTEALTRRGRLGLELVELWLAAHAVRTLYVTGADGLGADVWRALCGLGGQVGFDVVFLSAEPLRWLAELADVLHVSGDAWLRVDPAGRPVQPPVGAVLPDVGFPALPAACARLLEPAHAARAQSIYDECLVAAFDALPVDRLLEQEHADRAFRDALARTPDLGAVPLAAHALRAAGNLRGYDIRVEASAGVRGVDFDSLLTADRLDQLSRLVSPAQAAAGVLAGLPGSSWSPPIDGGGTSVQVAGSWQTVSARVAALLRAWVRTDPDRAERPPSPPPRPTDRQLLWRTPPPERLEVNCQPIDCRAFRRIADPPMDWTQPPRPRRRGSRRSAQAG